MVSLATPSPLDRILSEHVKNLSNLVLGASGYGQRVQFTQYGDSTNYANTFGNTDTTNGRAVKIQYGDPAGSPVTLATFQKSASVIQSADGTDSISVSNSGVAVTGTFTLNGSAINAGVSVYNVLDHGVVEGTGTTYAGANTSALQTLWTTTATAGGGVIYFPPGDYSFNATTLDHGLGTGATKAITIKGAGGSSIVKFYGSTGPYLTIASTATSPLSQCGIEDLYINHGQLPSSGATIRLGYVSLYHMEDVHLYGQEAFIGLQFIKSGNAHLRNCTFSVQNVANAVCVDFAQDVETGGVQFTGCNLSGPDSIAPASKLSRGIRFNNTATVDTVVLYNTTLKDHLYCINSGSGGSATVANLQMNGGYLDASAYNLVLDPAGPYYGWWFDNVWCAATYTNVLLNLTNGGSLSSIIFHGGYMTDATLGAVSVSGAVNNFQLHGVTVATNTNNGSYAGVEFYGAATNARVSDCYIATGTSAAACIKTASAATPLLFANNILRGSADADGIVDAGATSAARVITGNAYAA